MAEIDEVLFRIYWRRAENIEQAKERAYTFLLNLKSFDAILEEWYKPSSSRKKALEKRFEITPDQVRKELMRGRKPIDIDSNGFCDIGYKISLYKEDEQENPYSLGFQIGTDHPNFSNNCLLKYRTKDLFDRAKVLDIFKYMIKSFQPDYGCVETTKLVDELHLRGGYVGWITFAKQSNVKLPRGLRMEGYESFGNLIYLDSSEKFYDYNRLNEILPLREQLQQL